MRLLSFVKRLWFGHCDIDSVPPSEIFNARGLVYFSALTNIQELGFDCLDLCSFIPQVQPYLGHFMPRLRSLALKMPKGPDHLLLYLLGLFPNLDDFKLVGDFDRRWASPGSAPRVPQSAPLLRGRLTLVWFYREDFLRDLSKLSGGLRFRCMDLFDVRGTRFLLGGGAETLEMLRIHPARWRGNFQWSPVLASLTCRLTGCRASILEAFDLSTNRSLRSLEIEIALRNIYCRVDGMGFLGDLLSTVTSPVFSDVVIILQDNIIHDPNFLINVLFPAVRHMCEVRSFRLVFMLGKLPRDGEDDRERLKEIIDVQAARGWFGPLLDPPVIVSYAGVAWSVGSIDIHHLSSCGPLWVEEFSSFS